MNNETEKGYGLGDPTYSNDNRYGQRNQNDLKLLAEYAANPIASHCVDKNATQVARTGWKLCRIAKKTEVTKNKSLKRIPYREQKKIIKSKSLKVPEDAELVEVPEHEIIEILTRVNEGLNGYQLTKLTQMYLEIMGRAYWRVTDDEIVTLKPWCVTPVLDQKTGFVAKYEYANTNGYGKQTLDLDDVVEFRFVDPANPYAGGFSPLRGALTALRMSSLYNEWLATTIGNRQRPDWLLIPKIKDGVTLTPEEITRAEDELYRRVGGANNGKPLVMSGAFDAVNLSLSPTDLAPLQILQEVKKITGNSFAIPFALLDSDSIYVGGYDTAMGDWLLSGVAPRVCLLEQVLNENLSKLSASSDGLFIVFDNPVPDDKEHEVKEQTLNVAKVTAGATVLTDNEKRELLGFPPIEGGDEITLPPAPTTPAADEEADDAEPDAPEAAPDEPQKSFDALLELNRMVAKSELPRAQAINIAKAMGFADAKHLIGFPVETKSCTCAHDLPPSSVKAAKPSIEKRLKEKVASFFRRIAPEAIRRAKGVGGSSLASDLSVLLTTKADDGDAPSNWVPLDEWTDELADDVRPLIELGTKQSADGKAREYVRAGADPDFPSVMPAKIKDAAEKRAYAFADETMATTSKKVNAAIDAVRQQISEGATDGETNAQIAQRVGEIFENAADYQAERIARTETSWTIHQGQVIAAKESGIIKGFKYLVSADACEMCTAYEGEEIGIDEYDMSGGVGAEGTVPIHPNCTCTLEEIIDLGD